MSSKYEDEQYQREKEKAEALTGIASETFNTAAHLECIADYLSRLTIAAESIAATLADAVKCLKESA
jgi:hypothetical protein